MAEASASEVRLAGTLRPGPYAVGFHQEAVPWVAGAAELSGEMPSAFDLYLWFPIDEPPPESGPRCLTFGDYYRVQETTEPTPETLREWLYDDMTSPPGLDPMKLDGVLSAPMWASSVAFEPASGEHPLLLWSYRDSVPTMQAVLNEYIASHGYVVAFAWPVDHAPPFPWQEELTAVDKLHALQVQVELLERALDALEDRASVDTDRAAVLAWSYGGESANALQRERAEIRLAIGVDATLASGWVYQTATDLADLDRRELTAPYVLLRHGRARIDGEVTPPPELLAEVPAGAWHVQFHDLSHGNFNFPGGMLPGVLGLDEVSRWAIGGESARLGYEAICRHVVGFLDLYLRDVSADPSTWSAEARPGSVEVERYPPRGDAELDGE